VAGAHREAEAPEATVDRSVYHPIPINASFAGNNFMSDTKQSANASSSPAAHDVLSVPVDLGDRSYVVEIGTGSLDSLPDRVADWMSTRPIRSTDSPVLLVTDANLAATHAERVRSAFDSAGRHCRLVAVPAGETSKSLAQVADLYDHLVDLKADRSTVVVALGGGVVGDLAGFVAATYARGLPFVQVPTTLLAMVDSSVGGKTGVNHNKGKNLIGSFHQPAGVLIDTETLATLPDRDYRAGLAEVVKYGVILDSSFFAYLEQHTAEINAREPRVVRRILATSCELKANVVSRDEYETSGLRAVLNYGHTFAHAFEALAGYGELLHGEAVSIGMLHASRLAARLERIPDSLTTRQHALLEALHIPTRLPESFRATPAALIECMRLDKKSQAGRLRFVLPSRLGHVELVKDVPEELVAAVLAE
jgi:3-dehydroquinate synthase